MQMMMRIRIVPLSKCMRLLWNPFVCKMQVNSSIIYDNCPLCHGLHHKRHRLSNASNSCADANITFWRWVNKAFVVNDIAARGVICRLSSIDQSSLTPGAKLGNFQFWPEKPAVKYSLPAFHVINSSGAFNLFCSTRRFFKENDLKLKVKARKSKGRRCSEIFLEGGNILMKGSGWSDSIIHWKVWHQHVLFLIRSPEGNQLQFLNAQKRRHSAPDSYR